MSFMAFSSCPCEIFTASCWLQLWKFRCKKFVEVISIPPIFQLPSTQGLNLVELKLLQALSQGAAPASAARIFDHSPTSATSTVRQHLPRQGRRLGPGSSLVSWGVLGVVYVMTDGYGHIYMMLPSILFVCGSGMETGKGYSYRSCP